MFAAPVQLFPQEIKPPSVWLVCFRITSSSFTKIATVPPFATI